jgi:hypothetical protein
MVIEFAFPFIGQDFGLCGWVQRAVLRHGHPSVHPMDRIVLRPKGEWHRQEETQNEESPGFSPDRLTEKRC